MDVNSLIQLVGSLGFPICCCIFLIWQHNKENERTNEQYEKMRQTVENNTRVMWAICAKLDINLEELEKYEK